ncbi:accessory gene regulator B family protein [Paenibacillus peoriae]|uniref:accessory gene regulator ArgB-like protein n=1 Tax=Paenibacillus peoriae TaxID=59893 RepID=UPI00026C5BA6|nr:accessory gene regulator B family protein [Paenibacillus peoriae]MEC0181544.1 accessory gene regulator B family protein [Paenibacillus peoriae]
MIESLALRIATHIKSTIPDHPASVAVLKHSLSIVLNVLFIVCLTLSAALITDKVNEVSLMLVMFAILRQMTGGIHLKTGIGCVLVTSFACTVLSFITLSYNLSIWATILSIVLIFIYAPSRIEKQSRIPKRYYPLLKILAVILVGTNLIFASSILAISFLTQSITLIRR